MYSIEDLDKKLEIANKALSLGFKFGILIGGAVLLSYCWTIGYFPQDVSVGDGLLFIMLAIAFSGVYFLFVVGLTCLGLTLRPIWNGGQEVYIWLLNKYNWAFRRNRQYERFTIIEAAKEHFIFALFGLIFVYGFGSLDLRVVGSLVLVVFGCAFIWSLHQKNESTIIDIEKQDVATEEEKDRVVYLKKNQKFVLLALMAIPLLFGGVSANLIDGTMRLSNIRAEKVTVHIKEPYLKYASEYGLKGAQSAFGKDYGKFEDMSILFNGFGKNAVITQNGIRHAPNLVIPNDHIIVIKR